MTSTFSLNNEMTKLLASAAWRIEIRLPPTRAAIKRINQNFFLKNRAPSKRVEKTKSLRFGNKPIVPAPNQSAVAIASNR
jgi:hypothetical protein